MGIEGITNFTPFPPSLLKHPSGKSTKVKASQQKVQATSNVQEIKEEWRLKEKLKEICHRQR
jgi:hypothetical protein